MDLKNEIYENIHGDLTSIDDQLSTDHIENCEFCRKLIESITEVIASHVHDAVD